MQCVVHIGTEKTGSTSIQSAMLDQAEILDKHGVYLARKCGYPNNMLLPKSLVIKEESANIPTEPPPIPDERFNTDKILTDTRQEIAETKEKGYKTLIISSELFHSKFTGIEHVESLKTFLEGCGITEVRVIVYLRPQIDLAVSRYSTALRTGHHVSQGLPIAKPEHPFFNYLSMLEKWAITFDPANITPRIYNKTELFSECVVKDFLNLIDPAMCSEISYKKPPQNKQLSLNEQRILSTVNNTLKSLNIDRNQERKLRRKIIAQLDAVSAKNTQSINLPSEFEARCFQNAYEKQNTDVANRWFQRDRLFDLDFSKYQQQPQNTPQPTQKELFEQFQASVVPLLVEQMNEVESMTEKRNRLRKQNNRLKLRTEALREKLEC